MAGGYIPLPAYQVPRNALLDFSGLDSGLDTYRQGIEQAYKGQTNRLIGDALKNNDFKGATSAAFQRGDLDTGLKVADYGQKQDDRLKAKFGNAALLTLQESDPAKRAAKWQQILALHPDAKNLDASYTNPDTGPLALLSDAGMAGDYLKYQLQKQSAAIQAAQEGRAQQLFPGQLEAQRTGNALNAEKLDEAQNPQKAFEKRAAMAGQYGLQPGTADYQHFVLNGKLPDHSAQNKLGLQPIWGTGADGKPVLIQPSTTGDAVLTRLPPGVTLNSGTNKIDLGTSWGILDQKSGNIISTIPKDVAGKEKAEAVGKAQGVAQADLPRVQGATERMLRQIDDVLHDPNLGNVTGVQAYLPTVRSSSRDTEAKIAQLKGGAFLQAFEALKGGGQITEVEGEKATNALARLNDPRQTDEGFRKALQDFRGEVVRLATIAKQRAGQGQPASAPLPDPLGIR